MTAALVVGPWYRETLADPETGATYTLDRHNGARYPAVAVEYDLATCEDVTSQLAGDIATDRHAVACLVDARPAVLAALAADPRYLVLWVAGARPRDEVMPGAEYTALANWLVARGLTLAKARLVLGGATVSGRTREAIVTRLVLWLRTRTAANAVEA